MADEVKRDIQGWLHFLHRLDPLLQAVDEEQLGLFRGPRYGVVRSGRCAETEPVDEVYAKTGGEASKIPPVKGGAGAPAVDNDKRRRVDVACRQSVEDVAGRERDGTLLVVRVAQGAEQFALGSINGGAVSR